MISGPFYTGINSYECLFCGNFTYDSYYLNGSLRMCEACARELEKELETAKNTVYNKWVHKGKNLKD